jgi:VanZ family protein
MRPVLLYWAPAVLFAGLVLFLSLIPNSGGPDYGWDKLNHFMAYAVLSLLSTRAISAGDRISVKTAIVVMVIVFLFGILVEFLQSLTSTRSAEALDAAANGLGAISGAIIFSLIKNRAEVTRCL